MFNIMIGIMNKANDTRPECVFEETKGVKYKALNTKRKKIIMYQVDGKWPQDKRICDHALYIQPDDHIIFIELKGESYSDALEQILDTLTQYKSSIKELKVNARIVLSKGKRPNINYSNEIRINLLLTSYNGRLVSKERYLEERI